MFSRTARSGVVHDRARRRGRTSPSTSRERAALGHLLDGEVELVAGDEIDAPAPRAALPPARPRPWRRSCRSSDSGSRAFSASATCTSEANDGVRRVQHARGRSSRRAAATSSSVRPCGGASISLRARDQRGRLGQPGRIPERPDLAPRLVARAGAAVEAVERRADAGTACAGSRSRFVTIPQRPARPAGGLLAAAAACARAPTSHPAATSRTRPPIQSCISVNAGERHRHRVRDRVGQAERQRHAQQHRGHVHQEEAGETGPGPAPRSGRRPRAAP